jgi:hypothetical protein
MMPIVSFRIKSNSFPFVRYFSLSMSVQPCYNPIEIQSMPPRRFLAGKKEPGSVSIFFRSPPNGNCR